MAVRAKHFLPGLKLRALGVENQAVESKINAFIILALS